MDIKLYSYLYGLFGTDGSIKRTSDNQHICSLTLEIIDEDIINKILLVLPDCSKSERTRDTNFKKNYHSYILRCHNKDFILWCEKNNFPIQNKTDTIALPNQYNESDFWRGVIDGDGSIGLKKAEQQPFINLTTKSDALKEAYCDYIYKLTNFRPKCNRNKRDNIYNITLHGEKAIKILNDIYKDSSIYIERKYQSYLNIKDWKKQDLSKVVRLPWTKTEEIDLMTLELQDFQAKYPNRTFAAIRAKRARLKKEVMNNVNK